MAYKPFKPNRGNYYTNSEKTNNPKNEIVRMKLFGFRSGVAWKMIPALLYYVFMALFIVSSISGEIREFEFKATDVVLCFLKYLFIIIIAYSPAIFLSDFEYRDKLPMFKLRTAVGSALGLMFVIVASTMMIWVYQYCMSDTYKESADKYYEEMESINNAQMKEYKESIKEQENKN